MNSGQNSKKLSLCKWPVGCYLQVGLKVLISSYSSSSHTIEDLLNKWGLQGAEIPLKDFDADQGNVGGSSLSDLHTIHMLEITSKAVE